MTTRDLDRLAKHVKAHRLELYASRLAAAQAAGISKDTWRRVEEGLDVREGTYTKVAKALGWTSDSCDIVAEGGEPVLAHQEADGTAAVPSSAVDLFDEAEARRAAFEAARSTLPASTPIGAIDAFVEKHVEILRRTAEARRRR